ncbi:hypothetical protein J437_LFUL009102 [Ladona fulva]|uniref:EGF-like domain-containing protein n=1 Tax=Ladona fulva TaxID=123851 RepID=A0A8K0K4Y6_LADFU|nr:hypothetical protein J437_LFUL009102 [Ladona fulva]
MEYHQIHILLFLAILLVAVSGTGTSCKLSKLFVCGKDETCEQIGDNGNGVCKCRPGFRRSPSGGCDPGPTSRTPTKHIDYQHKDPDPPQASSEQKEESGHSGLSIALSTLLTIGLICGAIALIYAARRYKWHESMRRLGIRRYEELFIGRNEEEDDDAPIA